MTRTLVVDDDPVVRQFVSSALEAEGHAIGTAANGREAIAALETSEYDLVITDIFMPVKEGIETIIEIRRRWPGVAIIAMSAGARALDRSGVLADAVALGAHGALGKPFSVDELRIAIGAVGGSRPR